jgi:hypothetical protein
MAVFVVGLIQFLLFFIMVSSQHTYYAIDCELLLQCSVTPELSVNKKSANTQREANEETLQKMSNVHDVVLEKSFVIILRQQHVIK